jgi:hypothetical protein
VLDSNRRPGHTLEAAGFSSNSFFGKLPVYVHLSWFCLNLSKRANPLCDESLICYVTVQGEDGLFFKPY